jgi:hypothetical protein
VLVDGREVGTLDANGSLAPITISPDVYHLSRLQKAEFEPTELQRRPAAKETIMLSGTQARLRPFGKLEFTIEPPNAHGVINPDGESPRRLEGKLISLKEGYYSINANADGYEALKTPIRVEVVSGKTLPVTVKLRKKELPPAPPPPEAN